MLHFSRLLTPIALRSLSVFLATALLSICLIGCSGKGKEGKADSPGPESLLSPDDLPAEQPADIYITSSGIGDIKIGLQVGSIPEHIEGVYDSVIPEEGYESNSYVFVRDGIPLFTAYEFTPGTIDVISVDSPVVMVKEPSGGTLSLGTPFSRVLSLPGVVPQWENADGEGMWCWQWDGLWFQPDQSSLPQALGNELYNEIAPPSASSFTSDVKIGYIGTGLPW